MSEFIYDWTPAKQHRKEPIVRCRDCENGIGGRDGLECVGHLVQTWDYYNDEPLHNPVPPDGFCAWGVRREGK